MAKITEIEPVKMPFTRRKRVAAYVRVSMETDRLQHSFSAQVSRYSDFIQSNLEWDYAGVYSDDGISGTGTRKRRGFKEMMAECEAGNIDIILTKSISRFSRNTVDLLETIRHLKSIGVEVLFEKEHVSTFSEDGEFLLTVLASFAQAESESLSENVRWSRRKSFEAGKPHAHYHIYGYRWEGDDLVIVPEEAEVVRLFFTNYLEGISPEKTAEELTRRGITNTYGKPIDGTFIRNALLNVFYTGNMLLQRYYSDTTIEHKCHKNRGEFPQYFVQDTHEAIISEELFQKVQDEIKRREIGGFDAIPGTKTSCFTSRLVCAKCGHSYTRTSRRSGKHEDGDIYYTWRCSTYNRKGTDKCNGKRIREQRIVELSCEVLGMEVLDEDRVRKEIKKIVIADETIEFHLADGRAVTKPRGDNGNRTSWTPERREAQGRAVKEQWKDGRRGK